MRQYALLILTCFALSFAAGSYLFATVVCQNPLLNQPNGTFKVPNGCVVSSGQPLNGCNFAAPECRNIYCSTWYKMNCHQLLGSCSDCQAQCSYLYNTYPSSTLCSTDMTFCIQHSSGKCPATDLSCDAFDQGGSYSVQCCTSGSNLCQDAKLTCNYYN